MRQNILQQLHVPHLGREKTKLLARETVYWPNINKHIDDLVHSCAICQEHQPSQQAEPLLQHDLPTKPWNTIGVDLFEFSDNQWLIIADYYTKYPIIRKIPGNCSSHAVIIAMKQVFSEHGIPEKVVSDNGPQFASELFKQFASAWSFDHVTSPRRPQGNGFIERQTLPPLYPGQHVHVQNQDTGHWFPATVRNKTAEPRSYIIETPNGKVVRRNRQHIREAAVLPTFPSTSNTTDSSHQSGNADPAKHVTFYTPAAEASGDRSRFGRLLRPPQRFSPD
ncbi:hypothetical protein BSL78_17871 [Apostichopus japonicus]|uniref:Integrase catalytic domain-containing protein n=1 Tax=Stichopus japonicus TaxID=307972 RepID=A0A2G8KB93_STIJA|nr:hypothetical protein BSL78_17871 [Apostichopus japonicus]